MSFLQPHIYYFQVFGIPCLQFFFVDKLMKTVISQSLLKLELDSLKEILSSVLDTFKFAFAK